jgi:hypothetical protein
MNSLPILAGKAFHLSRESFAREQGNCEPNPIRFRLDKTAGATLNTRGLSTASTVLVDRLLGQLAFLLSANNVLQELLRLIEFVIQWG